MRTESWMCLVAAALAALLAASRADAAEWFVALNAAGTGTAASPFGRLQDAIDAAQAGDVVTIRPGAYDERFNTVRAGTPGSPIRIRSTAQRGAVVITATGRVATIGHANIVLENLVLDGRYGPDDAVRVTAAADDLVLRNIEVRRSSRDLIDIGATANVLIENCLIHHALNAAAGRTDAHGIAAGAVRNMTIRNTEIHTFSGDGVQVDPGRSAPGWDNVTLDSVRIWLAPLAAAENGFAAGTVPGENAIDTKAGAMLPRARITIRNTTAWGFRGGLISNMAAFNLKEHIDATLDRVTVHDSEIAFRLRGAGKADTGARVAIQNAVVYRVTTAYRYEDEIRGLRIWNNTVGREVTRVFRAASSSAEGLDVRNLLVLGDRPAEAAGTSNLAVGATAFVDAAADDYRLARGAKAIDAGVPIAGVTHDRAGGTRPRGTGYDVGAYEFGG